MKKVFYILASAALLFVGCTQEMREDVVPEQVKTILTISSSGTKTTIGDLVAGERQMYWANKDKVIVSGEESDELTGIVPNTVTSTEFSFASAPETPYNTVYPSTIWNDASTIILPGKATSGVVPLGGTSSTSVIPLGVLTSVLKISLKLKNSDPDTDNISYIEVSTSSTRLSGLFLIDYSSVPPTLEPAPNPTGNDLKVWLSGNWALSTDAQEFFIPVPAGTYSITVKVMDKNGHYMTKSTSSAKTFVRGEILALKAFEFNPSATDTGIEIDSAEDLVDFAEKFNAGEYDEVNPLVATLTNDIDFSSGTSLADFIAKGGIGTSSKKFNGVFRGKVGATSYSISNFVSTVPLFAYTDTEALLEDITMDNTCVLTRPAEYGLSFGSLVAVNKGSVTRCVSAAKEVLNLQDGATYHYGGLIGENVGGEINGCEYNGDIVNNSATLSNESSVIYVGGVVGATYKDSERLGNVVGSSFNGTITFRNNQTSNTTQGPNCVNLFVGGISGAAFTGTTVSSCEMKASAKLDIRGVSNKLVVAGIVALLDTGATVDGSDNNGNQVFVRQNSSASKTPAYVGGIVGENSGEITDSDNACEVVPNVKHETLASGGIAGYNSGSISGCTNSGRLRKTQSGYLCTYTYAGGIAGSSNGNIDNAENTGSISNVGGGIATAELYVGGCIGKLTGPLTPTIKVKNANPASVTITLADSLYTRIALGGVIGYAGAAIDGSGSKLISNERGVELTTNKACDGLCVGGIVGYTTDSINGCSNSGGVVCTGKYYDASKATNNSCVGGILGLTESTITISNCSNSGGIVYQKDTDSRTDKKASFVGGIVGKMSDGGTISSCSHTTNQIRNQNFNNTKTIEEGAFCGGIVGALLGTAEHSGSISSVTISNMDADKYCAYGKRGWNGGVAGYVSYTTINGTSCSADTYGTNGSANVAGVVGWMVSSTLKNFAFSGNVKNGADAAKMGGLVHTMDGASSIQNCTFDGVVQYDGGVVVYSAASGATITDCGVRGTINSTTITTDNNVIDASNKSTITGTYLLY